MVLTHLGKSGVSFTGGGAVTTPSELRDRIIRTLIGPSTNAVLRIRGEQVGSGMSLHSERLMHRLLSGSAPSERARRRRRNMRRIAEVHPATGRGVAASGSTATVMLLGS